MDAADLSHCRSGDPEQRGCAEHLHRGERNGAVGSGATRA
jgi:hypothetical protein